VQDSIRKILKSQNNNYPYLFVDRILEIDPFFSGIGKKCFSKNEWFFEGQLEEKMYVPEFIQIESLVQMLVITIQFKSQYEGEILNDVKFKNIEFYETVSPGDSLIIKSKVLGSNRGIINGISEGFVSENLVCRMECFIAVLSELNKFIPKI
jgi:3-hydroxyacyl-[acyl-carrier-protein] dehydratase